MTSGIPSTVFDALKIANADAVTQRYAMPPAFYTDFGVAAAERDKVFFAGWICVGRVDEVPEQGDYFVTEVLGESLLVVRGRDAEVRVLSNVCRHRASLLLENAGNTRNIVCPYHNWAYALDGTLKRAHLVDKQPGFNPAHCALPQFRSEQWMGWIFVNLSATAPPLADSLVSLDDLVANYHTEEMRTVKAGPEYWPINWKCLAENFMEGYHLTPVHRATLHPMTPTRLCEKVPGTANWTAYKSHYTQGFAGRPPFHPDMSDEESRMSMMVWVYPGFVAAISPNSAVYMSLTPTGVCEVQTRWGVIAREDLHVSGNAMQSYEFAASFNAEDKARLLDVQRGLNSKFATAGPLAPPDYEGCSWDFYGYMATQLLTD